MDAPVALEPPLFDPPLLLLPLPPLPPAAPDLLGLELPYPPIPPAPARLLLGSAQMLLTEVTTEVTTAVTVTVAGCCEPPLPPPIGLTTTVSLVTGLLLLLRDVLLEVTFQPEGIELEAPEPVPVAAVEAEDGPQYPPGLPCRPQLPSGLSQPSPAIAGVTPAKKARALIAALMINSQILKQDQTNGLCESARSERLWWKTGP